MTTPSESLLASPSYPEHEKLSAVQDQSQTIGEFLDFSGYHLCRIVRAGNNGEPRYSNPDGSDPSDVGGMRREHNPAFEEWGDHYQPVGSIDAVLAEYFGIDRDALEREKRAMLDTIRSKP